MILQNTDTDADVTTSVSGRVLKENELQSLGFWKKINLLLFDTS